MYPILELLLYLKAVLLASFTALLSNKDTLFFKSTLDINISPPNIFLDSLLNKILWFNDSHFISSILPYWSGT